MIAAKALLVKKCVVSGRPYGKRGAFPLPNNILCAALRAPTAAWCHAAGPLCARFAQAAFAAGQARTVLATSRATSPAVLFLVSTVQVASKLLQGLSINCLFSMA